MRPLPAAGIDLPWLSCYGNHDALMLGAIATDSPYDEFVTGSRKPQVLQGGLEALARLRKFLHDPAASPVLPRFIESWRLTIPMPASDPAIRGRRRIRPSSW